MWGIGGCSTNRRRTRKPSAKRIADVDSTDDISHEKPIAKQKVKSNANPNTKQSKWKSDGSSIKKAKKMAMLDKVDDEVE